MGKVTLDPRAQAQRLMKNMQIQLTDLGADLGNLVDVNCYLVSMNDFGSLNEGYNSYFDATTGPTRTTVTIYQFPHLHILLEIKGTAFKPRI